MNFTCEVRSRNRVGTGSTLKILLELRELSRTRTLDSSAGMHPLACNNKVRDGLQEFAAGEGLSQKESLHFVASALAKVAGRHPLGAIHRPQQMVPDLIAIGIECHALTLVGENIAIERDSNAWCFRSALFDPGKVVRIVWCASFADVHDRVREALGVEECQRFPLLFARLAINTFHGVFETPFKLADAQHQCDAQITRPFSAAVNHGSCARVSTASDPLRRYTQHTPEPRGTTVNEEDALMLVALVLGRKSADVSERYKWADPHGLRKPVGHHPFNKISIA